MNIVFRADASIEIGSGHIMRCLTLADALSDNGHDCRFICREKQGNLIDVIKSKGLTTYTLSFIDNNIYEENSELFHAKWLGTSQEDDLRDSVQQLIEDNFVPDWLVVDHYALDYKWESQFRKQFTKINILVIDDLADRIHDCNLLVDQNIGASEAKYFDKVLNTTQCQMLCGLNYALLRPEFSKWREYSLKRKELPQLKKVLVNLGGVDKDNITLKILNELEKCDIADHIIIDVVMGKSAPHIETIKKFVKQSKLNMTVSVNVSNMAERLANSDLAIGAAGSSSWERCCLGIPTLLFVLAENQEYIANISEQNNIARLVNVDSLCSVIKEMKDSSNLLSMIESSSKLIDGNGVKRVLNYMERKCI